MRVVGVESMRGIGRMSRESGLTVSALRFYDGAGLLCPAHVDPHTGYRFYAAEQVPVARLVAVLRRVRMPLVGIREVLEHHRDPAAVDALLAGHIRALEKGLADARRVLSTVPLLLEPLENPVSVTVSAPDLAAALRAVRFAAGSDPELPVLSSVLFDLADGVLTLVATDRYRLAMAPVSVTGGSAVAAVVPLEVVDEIAGLLPDADTVEIVLTDGSIAVLVDAREVTGALRADAFPDYRPLVPAERPAVGRDRAEVRSAVAAAPRLMSTREQDGVEFGVAELTVGEDGVAAVNREFLLEAIDAGGDGQLVLSLDGPLCPLVLRSARSTSLLMPVRL